MTLTKKQIKKYARLHMATSLYLTDNCGLEGLDVDYDSEKAVKEELERLALNMDKDCANGFCSGKQILDFILKGKTDETD